MQFGEPATCRLARAAMPWLKLALGIRPIADDANALPRSTCFESRGTRGSWLRNVLHLDYCDPWSSWPHPPGLPVATSGGRSCRKSPVVIDSVFSMASHKANCVPIVPNVPQLLNLRSTPLPLSEHSKSALNSTTLWSHYETAPRSGWR